MESRLILLVSLFVRPGREAAFRECETAAARIMARHGGRIERVIRPVRVVPEADLPHEIHLVSFPGAGAFAAYRADAELAALAGLRETAIARTEIVVCAEGEPY